MAEMYGQGRAFLRAAGVDQWQDGYPDLTDVLADIEEGVSYLLTADSKAAASMAVTENEPTYDRIYDGKWLTGEEKNYLAVHRVCVGDSFKRKGLTKVLYDFAATLAKEKGKFSLRADTHKDNRAMREALKKNGFCECGRIFLESGAERIAYEKILNREEAGMRQTQKRRIVVATGNPHKLREIAEIFPNFEIVSQKEAGFDGDVEETGSTFEENALLKAEAAARALGCMASPTTAASAWKRSAALPAYTAPAIRAVTATIGQTACSFSKTWRDRPTAERTFKAPWRSSVRTAERRSPKGALTEKFFTRKRGKTASDTIVSSRATISANPSALRRRKRKMPFLTASRALQSLAEKLDGEL